MNAKRLIILFLTVTALAALFTLSAYAQSCWTPQRSTCIGTALSSYARSWWTEASGDTAVYPTAPPLAAGDLDKNGTVNAADARQTLRFAVGLDAELLAYSADPDYDGDGRVSAEDARLVLRSAVGLEEKAIPQADDGIYRIRVSSMIEAYDLGALIPLETNADRVTDYKGGHLPLWRLRSADDVEAFCAAFDAAGIAPFVATMEIPAFLRRYGETFFADRELFICYTEEGSGSTLQAVYSPTVTAEGTAAAQYPLPDMSLYPALVKGRTLTFSVGSVCPEGVTCDIGNWFLFLPVEKIASAGCVSFDCLRGAGGIIPHAEYLAALEGKTKWAYAGEQLLPGSAEIALRTGGDETAFALENAQDGGYLWEYETDADVKDYNRLYEAGEEDADFWACDLWIKEELVCKPTAAPGAPGVHLYTIRANKPGTYTLRFALKRPWETEPIETRTVTLTVTDRVGS